MWKGRVLEILGLWLIVIAFRHNSPDATGWINLVTGAVVAALGWSLKGPKLWQRYTAYSVGLLLVIMALVPSFRIHQTNLWVDGIGGLLIWLTGWRFIALEMGGPWRLKDGPVF